MSHPPLYPNLPSPPFPFPSPPALPSSSQPQLIYTQMEQEAEQSELQDAASKARAEEERALVRSGKGDLPTTSLHRIAGVHNANVLVVRIWPGRDLLATGAGALGGGAHMGGWGAHMGGWGAHMGGWGARVMERMHGGKCHLSL